jgi:hypothetical protein
MESPHSLPILPRTHQYSMLRTHFTKTYRSDGLGETATICLNNTLRATPSKGLPSPQHLSKESDCSIFEKNCCCSPTSVHKKCVSLYDPGTKAVTFIRVTLYMTIRGLGKAESNRTLMKVKSKALG